MDCVEVELSVGFELEALICVDICLLFLFVEEMVSCAGIEFESPGDHDACPCVMAAVVDALFLPGVGVSVCRHSEKVL